MWSNLILTHLRYWGMANASMKMGIHLRLETQEVERKLYRDFMEAKRLTKVSDVN